MTINYYEENADDFILSTLKVDMSAIQNQFLSYLSLEALILDAGCGSGRDAKAFMTKGYAVEAFDASFAIAEGASKFLGKKVKVQTFQEVNEIERYDGIWCCASLLHVPKNELIDTMSRLLTSLKPGGCWYISFKYGQNEREKDGRHFTDVDEKNLDVIVENLQEVVIDKVWVTEDKRPERSEKWLNAILIKDS